MILGIIKPKSAQKKGAVNFMKQKVKILTIPLLMLTAAFIFRFAAGGNDTAIQVYSATSDIPRRSTTIYDMQIPAPVEIVIPKRAVLEDEAVPMKTATVKNEVISEQSLAPAAGESDRNYEQSRDTAAGRYLPAAGRYLPAAGRYLLPSVDTQFKAYMDYRTITDKKSPQWRLRELAYTDDYGFRRIVNDYVVALGTYYSKEVGERFRITLDTGVSFTVITGDIKDPAHTDEKNMYTPIKSGKNAAGCVVEFIVDTEKLDDNAERLGTISYFNIFEGNIKSIEKLAGGEAPAGVSRT
jgi:hypothetical protein